MIKKTVILLLIVGIGYSGFWLSRHPGGAPGFAALYACGDIFVSKRQNIEQVITDTQAAHAIFGLTAIDVNQEQQTVTASLLGLVSQTALFRPKLGCSLVFDNSLAVMQQQAEDFQFPQASYQPYFTVAPKLPALEQALDQAFAETNLEHKKNTRAVLVVKGNTILAERYAPEFDETSPLLGWSMTKSLLNTFTGILVKENKISLAENNLLPEWKNDERANITIEHLLNMSDGLDFAEKYVPGQDATQMLFNEPDTSAYVSNIKAAHPAGSRWNYSSGTSNLLAHILRTKAGMSESEFYDFMYTQVFNKLGMSSMVVMPDTAGEPIASSFGYATARDWAKFGLLYLQNGQWQGEQILPTDWVKYTTTPLEHTEKGQYKAQFWLNAGNKDNPESRPYPSLGTEVYMASGHDGQQVIILPKQELVIVRLGRTLRDEDYLPEELVNSVIKSL